MLMSFGLMLGGTGCKQTDEADVYRTCMGNQDRLCAVQAVSRLVTAEPFNATWLDTLAILYSNLGMNEQASLACARALNTRESRAVRLADGASNKALGKFDRAFDSYSKLLAAEPQDLEFQYENAYLLIRLGRDDEAMPMLDKVLAHPKAAELQMQEFVEQGSQMVPYAAVAHNLRGYIHTRKGQNQDAVAAYQASLSIFPDYFLAKNNLMVLMAQMKAQ
jgi:tetratricopeptide (TPR) repeat protein